jgi:hypothetical protein
MNTSYGPSNQNALAAYFAIGVISLIVAVRGNPIPAQNQQ